MRLAIFAGSWGFPEILIIIAVFAIAILVILGSVFLPRHRSSDKPLRHKSNDKPLNSVRYCTNCGKPVQQSARYCTECGHNLHGEL